MRITASALYSYTQCPHRIWRDIYGPQEEKTQETNPFVQLLWEKGVAYEAKIVQKLGEFVDINHGSIDERFKRTIEEMKKGVSLIYQGVIKHENLVGIPDLLRKTKDKVYIPVDIKSGKGLEGGDEEIGVEGKPKEHYAVQLCLYVEVLKNIGFAKENIGVIIDISGSEVLYDLNESKSSRDSTTWWEAYENIKREVKSLLENHSQNLPALSGTCKLCPWYESCKKWCTSTMDLTNIFSLSRNKRDLINQELKVQDVKQLSEIDIQSVVSRKKTDKNFLKGIGEATLVNLSRRAKILAQTKQPVIYEPIKFPKVSVEVFFDIEDDPTQDFIYLHGVYERKGGKGKFYPFLAEQNTSEEEKKTWREFWRYIQTLPQADYAVYYYSHHEKTAYKRLFKKYPDVVSEDELNKLFENPNVIDLYGQIIAKKTDWPVSSYSLKDLASYIGFQWRDKSPSGALSIQWYNTYLESGDKSILTRILEYNEDDCKAMMVLKDTIEKMANKQF